MSKENFFSGNILDRSSELRNNKKWLTEAFENTSTKFLVFKNCQPLIEQSDNTSKLILLNRDDITNLLDQLEHDVIFLGRDRNNLGLSYFAINFRQVSETMELESILSPGRSFPSNWYALLNLQPSDASLVSQAKSVFHWNDRYRFCPTCGNKMVIEEAGYKRKCIDGDCRSNKGVHNTCYPRTDPTVIMCITSPDGIKCLLGRKRIFPKKMYSCLAGFVEPGESIEDAVKRETKEESGINVDDIHYVSSQPWPHPSSLMIGCIAKATSDAITVCEEEMEDVRWFDRSEVELAMKKQSNILILPPQQAIAHQLIKFWLQQGHPSAVLSPL